MRLLRAFVSEYGRYSATKTVWTAFATVFLLSLIHISEPTRPY